ncbi:MAG: hypothetical protein ABMA64_02260 [Myxococcota bacterium]
MLPLLSVHWAAPLAHAAGCDPATIETALTSAEKAFPSGDAERLEQQMFVVRKSMACTREPLSPTLCSRIHRGFALQRWLEGDPEASTNALGAMLHADPYATLPNLVVGDRHPLRIALLDAEEVVPSWTDAPGGGWVLVDGLRSGAVPVGQPYVLQPLKDDGRAGGARLVDRPTSEPARGGSTGSGKRTRLRLIGAGLGVVSATLYSSAWVSRGAYFDAVEAGDNFRISRSYGNTNGLAIGSVAALGLGTGAVVAAELLR